METLLQHVPWPTTHAHAQMALILLLIAVVGISILILKGGLFYDLTGISILFL